MPVEDAPRDASMEAISRSSLGATKEFVVEFLGGLVPGVAFLLALVPALLLPVVAATAILFPAYHPLIPSVAVDKPLSVGLVLFLVIPALLAFLVFAYIAGHLFYRQDPKVADHASFLRIPRHKSQDGMVRAVEGGDIPVEFPYHYLMKYLEDRGILYLADRVPWEPGSFKRRAKHFANALKIRILIENPSSFGILARNEGHVRLSSSMWYVSRLLFWLSVMGLLIYFGAVACSHIWERLPPADVAPVFVPTLFVLAASWLGKWAIERVLHYQREREVLFILETAHWLCVSERVPKIFDGLEPQQSDARENGPDAPEQREAKIIPGPPH